MWLNNTYINEKNVVVAEPYVQDSSYGIKINGIPVEIGNTTSRYGKAEKLDIIKKIIHNYIIDIER